MVEKVYSFAIDKVERLNLDEYPDDEFAVAKLGFLSTAPNSHGLRISEEVLRQNADSALGRFVVAKILFNDTMGHENNQNIFGYVPKEQEIEFIQEGEYLRASCLAVISKVYAEEFCDILERDGEKSISVEMKTRTPEDDESNVLAFRIFGITVLGQRISPSCPNSSINFVRFSEEKANDFYNKIHKSTESKLNQFAQSRREQFMAETKKTYKVDKSKEAISTKAWGEVNKAELRDKIMNASNRTSLVKDVYMLVEDGWEDSPSEHLKYPVMNFDGDVLVYNRDGLASALGYAKKENETAVITKVEKIYKKLGLEEEGKEEDKNMSKEIDKKLEDEIEGRKAWAKVIKKVQDHEGDGTYVDSIENDHIIYTKGDVRYRVEADIETDPDDKSVDAKIKWDTVKKDADQKMSDEEHEDEKDEDDDKDKDDDKDEDKEEDEKKMSCEDVETKMAEMQADIESRDNIIMEKDKELEELRKFKADVENKEKALSVDAIMSEVKECFEEVKFSELRNEGLACDKESLDAWSNKVKAIAFSSVKKPSKKNPYSGVFSFAAPVVNVDSTPKSVWDRLKNQ